MFSLRDPRFVFCSRDLDVLRAQRIMDFCMLITHKSMRSENPITYTNDVKGIITLDILMTSRASLLYTHTNDVMGIITLHIY